MRYTVRVELREPPKGDYDALHEAMEADGFHRWAFTAQRALPTAEYAYTASGETQDDVDEVRDLAVAAAATVHPKNKIAVLVTPVAIGLDRRSFGLEDWDEED
jgi:hypothetical protein